MDDVETEAKKMLMKLMGMPEDERKEKVELLKDEDPELYDQVLEEAQMFVDATKSRKEEDDE